MTEINADRPTATELVTTARPKSVTIDMADRYGMEAPAFEATVRAICVPASTTREEFAAFLLVAKEYHLNPLTKEIYAFPKRGGGIVPIVSIDGWVSLVNSHPAADGFSFAWEQDDKGDPISCTCTMYRKDRAHPVAVTEYYSECVRPTEPWKMKHRMLRHKAMIQAARYAFGFSGIYDEDEGEKIAQSAPMRDVTPAVREFPPVPGTEPSPAGNGEATQANATGDVQDSPEAETPASAPANEDRVDFLDMLETGLKEAHTDEEVDAAFDEANPHENLAGDDEGIAAAFALKAGRKSEIKRELEAEGQGSMFPGDKPFSGDAK